MNPDIIPEGEHCASTSNRNFEGRQGKGARTHLVSPVMAAAAAIYGHLSMCASLKLSWSDDGCSLIWPPPFWGYLLKSGIETNDTRDGRGETG